MISGTDITPCLDIGFKSSGKPPSTNVQAYVFDLDREQLAAEMLAEVEKTLPLNSATRLDFAMQLVSAEVQGLPMNNMYQELKDCHEGLTLTRTAVNLVGRFEQYGGVDNIKEAIRMLRRALELVPQIHSYRPSILGCLPNVLLTFYEEVGEPEVLAEAIRIGRQVLMLTPQGHADRGSSLCNLDNALLRHYEQTGDTTTLAETISLHQEALILHPQDHPNRGRSLYNLALALLRQCERTKDKDALAEVISLLRQALALHPKGHPYRDEALNNLAGALHFYYEQTGDTVALAELIGLYREALILHPKGHSTYAKSVINLATALLSLYEKAKDTDVLAEAIDLYREALEMHPQGHPNRNDLLNNYATALLSHYEQTGDVVSLLETTSLHHEALALQPQGHYNRGMHLINFFNAQLRQFQLSGNEDALASALEFREQMLNALSHGHLQRYYAHHSIARVLLSGSLVFSWTGALEHLMHAVKDNNASPRKSLRAAIQSLILMEHTSARDMQFYFSQPALHVYVETIQLLPRAAHAGLDLSDRLHQLSGSEKLCRTAAMRAILLQQTSTAVEIFEEGKAVFWSQALRLRSTALDSLPAADRDRLSELFQSLEKESSGTSAGVQDRADMERLIEHRRQLNDQADRLVEEIRARPGFDRFLKIPQFEKLAQAAAGGFVVALVASEPVCFAIVIRAEVAPQAVNLSSVNVEGLRKLCAQISGSGMRDGPDRGITKERIRARVPLEQMWRAIVEPVVLHLRLQVRHQVTMIVQ
jgi:tetratricopeptide (TPR) repeat protein